MRAVWIATVANIDWPSQKNLSPIKQREEMRNMLDEFAKNNINAIVIQIRPTADAFYPSTLEPWSQWLTGKQGTKPSPFYDPLQFIIEEAHSRFIEVHAWLNPYRVTNTDNIEQLNSNHLYFKNKDLFKQRCRDTADDDRGLIVVLDDEDVCSLIDLKSAKDQAAIDTFLEERFKELIN